MHKSTEQENSFLTGPILSPFICFTFPLMVSLLLQALYGGADLAVTGKFSCTESVSAVATGSQVMQVITTIITGLTMGVTIQIGKAMGAGNLPKAGKAVCAQIRLFAAVVVVLTILMVAAAPSAARLMNVPGPAFEETVRYIRICSAGIVMIAAYNGISGIFRGIGNSRSPFIFVAIACLFNIVLDFVFVGFFDMAASGAALATVIAQSASVLFSLIYMKKNPLPFSVAEQWEKSGAMIKDILKIGSPIALQDFLTGFSFLIITGIVNTLGVVASAGVGVAEKLFVFLSIVPSAFMSGLSTCVAQNMGAGNIKRAGKFLKEAQKISLLFGVFMFFLTFFCGKILASCFVNDPEVLKDAALYLKGSSGEYLIFPLVFCFLGYFNGREHTFFVMAQGLTASFCVRIPLSYLLSRLPDSNVFLISIAVPVSAFVSLLLCVIYFIRLRKQDRK